MPLKRSLPLPPIGHPDDMERAAAVVPTPRRLDTESAEWIANLSADAPRIREAALARLHSLLLRAAGAEAARRAGSLGLAGPELDDLIQQAADDALLAIGAKLGEFRGDSRFTTWAYKFVVFEVAGKLTRHTWRRTAPSHLEEDWGLLPDRFGFGPADVAEFGELLTLVRTAVDEDLTPRQRRIFMAIVLQGVPLDVLVEELQSSRNAIYKSLFDARRKIRSRLVANGYMDEKDVKRP
jgi:RNA polymerase sigma-70 factor (ECF subfamily)